jgi:peptide/nickel transport system permease protein
VGRYIARRLAAAIPVVAVVATATFFLVQLTPGDPASVVLGESVTKAQLHAFDHKLGLDRPVVRQYTSWVSDAVHGNLGTSYVTGERVSQEVKTAVPVTLSIALLATLLSLILGTLLGTLAAVRGGRLDRIVHATCSTLQGIPAFWLAAGLVYLFAVEVRVFPVTDYVSIAKSPWQWLVHLALPVLAVSAGSLSFIAFQARAAVNGVLGQEFVRTLQALGISRRRILIRHVLRNAAIPIVTVAGLGFVFTLGGVVIIESIYDLSGLGSLILQAVQTHDLPVVEGAVLVFSLIVVVVNLLVDVTVAWLDPRTR